MTILAGAVEGVARDRRLSEGSAPVLSPPALADWKATCYLPKQVDAVPVRPIPRARKSDLVVAGKALGGAGLTGAVLYLVATVPTHVHVYWPYWIFLVGVLGRSCPIPGGPRACPVIWRQTRTPQRTTTRGPKGNNFAQIFQF
jgi:hypothetical protein